MGVSVNLYDFLVRYIEETAPARSGTQADFVARATAAGFTLTDINRVAPLVYQEFIDRLVIKTASFSALVTAAYDATAAQRARISNDVRVSLVNSTFRSEEKQSELTLIQQARATVQTDLANAQAVRDEIVKAFPTATAAIDAGIRALQASEARLGRAEVEATDAVSLALARVR